MIKSESTEEAKFVENELSGAVGRDFAPPGDRGFVCSLKQNDRISQCRFPDRPWLQPVTVNQIGLLQLAITWYKIRHAGGQAHYYSHTGTSKQRQVKLHWFRSLCFNVSVRE